MGEDYVEVKMYISSMPFAKKNISVYIYMFYFYHWISFLGVIVEFIYNK